MSWSGFSEEELKNIQVGVKADAGSSRAAKPVLQSAKNRPQRAVPPMKQPSSTPELPNSAFLSVSPKTEDNMTFQTPSVATSVPTENRSEPVVTEVAVESVAVDYKQMELLNESDGQKRDLNSLQTYQQQQKMLEELNKQKKQMLSKALAERAKQTNAEAVKLKAIQRELSLLDQMLNVDVSLIRDKIEESTRQYAEASKRYEFAEKEFIEAKIKLHKTSEMKEQLTEHLYTIIHQNEIRKSKKLAELMEKMEIACDGENSVTPLQDLPSYSLLGNIQTIGSGNLVKKQPVSPASESAPTYLQSHGPDDLSVNTEINSNENIKNNEPQISH